VRDFVLGLPETEEFLTRTLDLLRYVVPKYEHEGKSYLTIAFGCTGGMHRSVVLADQVAKALDASLAAGSHAEAPNAPRPRVEIAVVHRDVERDPRAAVPSVPPRSQL
jgi:UPF0042 nucleotide-binding protein